jgi:hypothetical protein
MKAEILSRTDLLFLPEIALFLFVAVFAIALYRVLRPGAARYYEPHTRMPLDDGQPVFPVASGHADHG